MVTIETVKPRGKHFFTLTFEGGEKRVCHTDTVLKYGLLQKKSLDDETFKAFKRDDAYYTLMHHALNHLSKKDHSRRGLTRKLYEKSDATALIHQVCDALEARGYLNDQKVLTRIIKEAAEFDDKGPRHWRDKLISEGFDVHDVDDALTLYDDAAQEATIRELIDRTLHKFAQTPLRKKRQKLQETLYRKGFDVSAFERLINEKLSSLDSDDTDKLHARLHILKQQYNMQDYEHRQKLIQKLMREGYHYGDIVRALKG